MPDVPAVKSWDEYNHDKGEYWNTQADLVLDVRSTRWGIEPVTSTHHSVYYAASLVLFDKRTNSVLANWECRCDPISFGRERPTYEQLIRNDGALVRELLGGYTDTCLDLFRLHVLGLY